MNVPLLRTLILRFAKRSKYNARSNKFRASYCHWARASPTCVTFGSPQQARPMTSHSQTNHDTSNICHSFFSKKNGQYCFELGSVSPPFHSKNHLGPEFRRHFTHSVNGSLDSLTFETRVEDILESLLDFFEQLGDEENVHSDFDVTYSAGVLTVHFGPNHGTYVINKQTPNKQIWLSSPTSGPKRYDLMGNDWVYSHDGVPMLHLLSEEISGIIGKSVNLYKVIKLKDT